MSHHEPDALARSIEHTLLAPEATTGEVERLCEEAVRYGFHGVCVNPIHVRPAADAIAALLGRSDPGYRPVVITVVGFPLGACKTETKADAARRAMDDGADEIDMVPPLGALIEGEAATVRADIAAVARVVHGGDRSGVTGGTMVIADEITIRITARPGDTFIDHMISLVEGAVRQRTPNEIALTLVLSVIMTSWPPRTAGS